MFFSAVHYRFYVNFSYSYYFHQKQQNLFHVKTEWRGRKLHRFTHCEGSSKKKKELHLYTQSNNDQDSTTLHAISAFLSDIAAMSDDGLLAFFLKVAMTEKLQVAYFPSIVKVIVCIFCDACTICNILSNICDI